MESVSRNSGNSPSLINFILETKIHFFGHRGPMSLNAVIPGCKSHTPGKKWKTIHENLENKQNL